MTAATGWELVLVHSRQWTYSYSLVIPSDTGYYDRAIVEVGAGKNVLAFSKRTTWSDYVKLWTEITDIPASFKKTTVAEHALLAPDGYGAETAEMYAYAMDFGYDGSDASSLMHKM